MKPDIFSMYLHKALMKGWVFTFSWESPKLGEKTFKLILTKIGLRIFCHFPDELKLLVEQIGYPRKIFIYDCESVSFPVKLLENWLRELKFKT